MAEPSVPFGLVGKFFKWLLDLAKAPGRLAALEKGLVESNDPRPVCRVCGKGRVPFSETLKNTLNGGGFGRCDNCGQGWTMSGGRIITLWNPVDDIPVYRDIEY